MAAAEFHSEELWTAHPLVPLRADGLRLIREDNRAGAAEVAATMERMYVPGFLNALAIAEVFAALEDADGAFHWS